ncbi:MAG TPA: VWA domain-containing protein, partial [Bryobacteraceae bacterium]|nr:VWA domain-containing protein [Bryobacteraceae bacterium]
DRALIILLLTCCSMAFAQQQPAATGDDSAPEATFRSDTRLVELHATVTDKQGRILENLPERAFKVFENDVPQQIKDFRREDAPVSLGLIIDNSASMRNKRAQVAAALLTLVRASNPGDEEFVMNFNEQPEVVQDFTRNIGELEATLNKIDSSGSTALRDALAMALAHVTRLGKNEKKVLLVVTDGEDNSSAETLARLSRRAQQSGVLIYAIGLLNESNEREAMRAKHDLDTLTFETGGEVFYPAELSEVDAIARHVAHDLRNQYTITYIPTDQKQDGTYRRIKVAVGIPEGSTVRTRSGYYASARPES